MQYSWIWWQAGNVLICLFLDNVHRGIVKQVRPSCSASLSVGLFTISIVYAPTGRCIIDTTLINTSRRILRTIRPGHREFLYKKVTESFNVTNIMSSADRKNNRPLSKTGLFRVISFIWALNARFFYTLAILTFWNIRRARISSYTLNPLNTEHPINHATSSQRIIFSRGETRGKYTVNQ